MFHHHHRRLKTLANFRASHFGSAGWVTFLFQLGSSYFVMVSRCVEMRWCFAIALALVLAFRIVLASFDDLEEGLNIQCKEAQQMALSDFLGDKAPGQDCACGPKYIVTQLATSSNS